MGFLGLFIGPVLMALIVSIWREWIREVKMSDSAEVAEVDGDLLPEGPTEVAVVRKTS
jgi:predicted PurR-regulated permease PerM